MSLKKNLSLATAISALMLAGCSDDDNHRAPLPAQPVADESPVFSVDNYSTEGSSSESLTGSWLVIADYDRSKTDDQGFTAEAVVRERFSLRVEDNGDNTLDVFGCMDSEGRKQLTVRDGVLTLDKDGLEYRLHIGNNQQISGEVFSTDPELSVVDRGIDAIKLTDDLVGNNGYSLGATNITATLDGADEAYSSLKVGCFTHVDAEGETVFPATYRDEDGNGNAVNYTADGAPYIAEKIDDTWVTTPIPESSVVQVKVDDEERVAFDGDFVEYSAYRADSEGNFSIPAFDHSASVDRVDVFLQTSHTSGGFGSAAVSFLIGGDSHRAEDGALNGNALNLAAPDVRTLNGDFTTEGGFSGNKADGSFSIQL